MKGALKGQKVMNFPPSNIGGLDPVVMTTEKLQLTTIPIPIPIP